MLFLCLFIQYQLLSDVRISLFPSINSLYLEKIELSSILQIHSLLGSACDSSLGKLSIVYIYMNSFSASIFMKTKQQEVGICKVYSIFMPAARI